MTTSAMRVLITASWYPSFDVPGRGVFIADQASRPGADRASPSTSPRGSPRRCSGRTARRTMAAKAGRRWRDAWCEAIRTRGSSVAPRAWGAPGIDTVRLPVATPTDRRCHGPTPGSTAASAAEALLAWAAGPRFRSPAIVHAHVGLPDGVAAIALAERLGVPLVTTEHERTAAARLTQPGMRDAYLPLLAEGRMLLAVSQSLRDQLASRARGRSGADRRGAQRRGGRCLRAWVWDRRA